MQAIDLLDEAGSRVRIQAFSARKLFKQIESPKISDYLQVSVWMILKSMWPQRLNSRTWAGTLRHSRQLHAGKSMCACVCVCEGGVLLVPLSGMKHQ